MDEPRLYDHLDHVEYLQAWVAWRNVVHPNSSSLRKLTFRSLTESRMLLLVISLLIK